MPKETVEQKLMNAGYERITELEADDGHWEGEGFKAGKKMQFHAAENRDHYERETERLREYAAQLLQGGTAPKRRKS